MNAKKPKNKGWTWKTAGNVAQRTNIPLGRIACPHCGSLTCGVLDPNCPICEKPYWPKQSLSVKTDSLSQNGKIDAYNMAISYLQGEECAYDSDGDYKLARLWLANKLDEECKIWMQNEGT